jgi:hypothetical protein
MPGPTPKGSTDLICEDLHIHRRCPSHSTGSAELVIRSTGASLFITAAGQVISRVPVCQFTTPIALFQFAG